MDISLRFNVRIDGQRSRLTIKMPDGTMHNLHITQDPATPNVLQSHIDDLPAGACTLTWNVLASDGHMSKGQIPFTAQ